MVDQLDCLWTLLSLLVNLLQVLRKAISMALSSNSSPHHVLEMAIKNCKVHPAAGDENPASVSVTEGPGVAEEASVSSHCEVAVRESLERKKRVSLRARKRPGRIIIPESFGCLGFGEVEKEQDLGEKEIEVEGGEFCLASRRGSRHVMEDGYGVITNIHGDYKQAYFGVFDGHGGRAAVDFVAENLGKNIFAALAERAEEEREHEEEEEEEEDHLELAIKQGYLTTDKEFLSQGVSSGACAATVLLKDGDLRVANVGDCRVVISRKGVATALTNDHRPGREDERLRIENLGGYVNCKNGTWRVQDSLAVSRSIGDMNMKEWIISEPEMSKLRLTSDCEFLILASDGLWDKVANQEAVDVVSRSQHSIKSCKELVELSWRRGGRDDITVMVVDLQRFV